MKNLQQTRLSNMINAGQVDTALVVFRFCSHDWSYDTIEKVGEEILKECHMIVDRISLIAERNACLGAKDYLNEIETIISETESFLDEVRE